MYLRAGIYIYIYSGGSVWKLYILKWAFRKQDLTSVPGIFQPEHVCNIFSRVCLFKAGIVQSSKHSLSDFTQVLPQQLIGNSCQFYHKVCEPAAGLKSYIRMRGVIINAKYTSYASMIISIYTCI